MALDVAKIASKAFTGVSKAIRGVVHDAKLVRETEGVYNNLTDKYETTEVEHACRAIFNTDKAAADIFPDYIVGANEHTIDLEGLPVAPKEVDKLKIGVQTFAIVRVADVAGAGQFFSVLARNS